MQGTQLLLPIAVAVLFWLLIIRPQTRRARELRSVQSSLAVGDAVMLTSGIHGTVVDTADETLQIEVAPGVQIKVSRGAVGMVAPSAAPGVIDDDLAGLEEPMPDVVRDPHRPVTDPGPDSDGTR